MAVGAAVAALSFVAFTWISPAGDWTRALPGAVLFGLGLSIAVTPLTEAALGALDAKDAGVASGVNNAVARLAGLLGVAVVPWAAGLTGAGSGLSPERLDGGFRRAMWICAGLCLLAALAAAVMVRPPGERERAGAVNPGR